MIDQNSRICVKKIIVRAPNWLGDAVMLLPVLAAFKEKHPDSHISVLVRDHLAPLLARHPVIDKVLVIPAVRRWKGVAEILRMPSRIRDEGFDGAILFTNTCSTAFAMFLARVPQRVGYRRYGRGAFLTHAHCYDAGQWQGRHQVDYYAALAGVEVHADQIKDSFLRPSQEARHWAEAFLRPRRSSSVLIGYAPGAQYGPAKQWPIASFRELGCRLTQEQHADLVLMGTGHEKDMAEELVRHIPGTVMNAVAKTDLAQLIGLLARCDVTVCNDSGVAHVSAALGIPTIVLFGSTDPIKTRPLGCHVHVFATRASCSPCFQRICPLADNRYQCFDDLTVEDVFQRIRDILK